MQTKKPAATVRICDEGIALDEPRTADSSASLPPRTDDWAARKRSRDLSRELQRLAPSRPAGARHPINQRRLDPPQDLFAQLESVTAPGLASIAQSKPTAAQRNSRALLPQLLSWVIVAAGSVLVATGVGGIAWSISSRDFTHWNLALGLALGGQGVLIAGLVLVVGRLWRTARQAANRLQDMQARLAQLQTAAEALTASRTCGAPAFYADLVRSASPHVLLANLKGQLDQLATHVGSSW